MKKYLSQFWVISFYMIVFLLSCEEEKAPTYDVLLEEHNQNEFSTGGAIALGVVVLVIYLIVNHTNTKPTNKKSEEPIWDDDDEWEHPTV